MSASLFIAWFVPIFVGVVWYLAVCGAGGAGVRSATLGYGTLLGLLLTGAFASFVARTDTTHALAHASPWLVFAALAACLVAWKRRSRAPGGRAAVVITALWQPRWKGALLLGLLAALVLRAGLIAREIWLRPTYPWDAWVAWAVKAKAWFLLGHHVTYAAGREWLAQPDANLYTSAAWTYPNALTWIEVWFASAAGGWIEPLINLPWLAVWIALLLGHYGQWRALGLCRMRAVVFVYALGSLPLINVHAALAGYADVWVAAMFGFGVLAWMRWLQRRERAQLALALVCAATLPFLKLEGWVWAAALLLAVALAALSARWRWRVVLASLAIMIVMLGLGGLRFVFAKLGWVDAAGAIVNPHVGAFGLLLHLHWHRDAMLGIVETVYAHPNWHLLWWLLPAVVVWRGRELLAREWLWLPGLLLLACIGALVFLFTATDAASWAQSFTAVNRLLLQLTPACVSLLALLLRDAQLPTTTSDTVAGSAPRSDPA